MNEIEPPDDSQYQAWISKLAEECRCIGIDKPCEGLMGGGMCDKFDREKQDDE